MLISNFSLVDMATNKDYEKKGKKRTQNFYWAAQEFADSIRNNSIVSETDVVPYLLHFASD